MDSQFVDRDNPALREGPSVIEPPVGPSQQPGSADVSGPPPQVIYVQLPPMRTPQTRPSPAWRTPFHRLSEFALALAQALLALLLLGPGSSEPLHSAVGVGVVALLTARVARQRAGLRGQDGGIRRRPPPSCALCSRWRPPRAVRTSWTGWAQPVLDGIVDVADGLLAFLEELFEQLK